MAPEALQKSPKNINVKAADMWSFAVLLWELSAREVPFDDLSPMEAGMKVINISNYLIKIKIRLCSLNGGKDHVCITPKLQKNKFNVV